MYTKKIFFAVCFLKVSNKHFFSGSIENFKYRYDDDIRCTPLTTHDRTEIDHIKLVVFQIKVEKGKRGPSGFQFFVCFDVIRPEDQSQCMILSQRGPPRHASVVLICDLDTKSYTTENWVDPSFLFEH